MLKDKKAMTRSRGLSEADFIKIADEGLGDGLNAYAHTMAWFQDHLYVGTTRANLCMVQVSNPLSVRCWPVKCPDDVYDLDRRAQIWRYNPRSQSWQQVLTSPMVDGVSGNVPRDIGYRGMAVFQGVSDPAPALYVCTWSPSRANRAPIILRSSNGIDFAPVSKPSDDPALNTYRTLLPFKNRLYTSPTGKTSGWQGRVHQGAKENMSDAPVVLENPDPASDVWRPVSRLGFGDTNNVSLFEMAAFNGFLYVGTVNPTHGFQLWKAQPTGEPPYRWYKVITNGAYRGNLNELAISMCVFNNALYVGTGIQNGGYDRTYKVGPAAAEIIRIHPDDSWDLIVGEPRLTPEGFKYPLSGRGPGFDDFFNGYIWRMCVHDGWLYAGTYNWSVFLSYLSLDRWPTLSRMYLERIGIENIVRSRGGFDLWRSRDGENWVPVTLRGFNNLYNYGIRTLTSTPFGLFVGTANPFGPEVAVETSGGWKYVPNPKGGLEIWLGTPERKSMPPNKTENVTSLRYDTSMYEDLVNEYYAGSDFHNLGLWLNGAQSQKEACENLMEELLSYIPEKKGTILDVACGKGASTKYLLNYYPPANVTGINISAKQLETCKVNAPGCTFLEMDATDLHFEDVSFDSLICVESAFHFNTREKFLQEAWRVLKPGGRLVLSDILFVNSRIEGARPDRTAKNYVSSLEKYESLYLRVGFENVEVIDATHECLSGFYRHCRRFLLRQSLGSEVNRRALRKLFLGLVGIDLAVRYYVLVSAQKPNMGANLYDGHGDRYVV